MSWNDKVMKNLYRKEGSWGQQWHSSGIEESGGDAACHCLTVNTSEVAFYWHWIRLECHPGAFANHIVCNSDRTKCSEQGKMEISGLTRSEKCVMQGRPSALDHNGGIFCNLWCAMSCKEGSMHASSWFRSQSCCALYDAAMVLLWIKALEKTISVMALMTPPGT